jgi:hypothetical protein
MQQESLILDIDMIQNHGKFPGHLTYASIVINSVGVGATDIAKLKSAGYWTVVVSLDTCLQPTEMLIIDDSLFTVPRGRL